jgi:predicted  nucleic acid-binding Zn-ribbon protein
LEKSAEGEGNLQSLTVKMLTIDERLAKLDEHPTDLEVAHQRLESKMDQMKNAIDEPVVLAVHQLHVNRAEEEEITRRQRI